MARKAVSIRIAPDGTVTAETHGVKGADCLAYIPKLEELMQAETIDSEFTAEYYETERTQAFTFRRATETEHERE